MNIKILDSWLRDYLDTKATPQKIGEMLSLSSVSVDRIVSFGEDFVYDIEVTTNRPDLMSVLGIAREAAAILPQFGITARFIKPNFETFKTNGKQPIEIISDPKLTNRILAVSMNVNIKPSPKEITGRLEAGDIRSLNNVIDVTNYVMRSLGHPTHVFDLDRLNTKILTIREAKKGEQIETLDNKIYSLKGSEIVAVNDHGEIVDLLGVMGLANSVVTEDSKNILFFINNNDPRHIRRTSMELGIRTEAAIINEKILDPEAATDTMFFGIEMFRRYADATNISEVLDIYPNKPKNKTISVSLDKVNKLIGVRLDIKKSLEALDILGFKTKVVNEKIETTVPTFRLGDVEIEEDIIEEIARVHGYHNLPSILPPLSETIDSRPVIDNFYWEKRIKNTMKYWGFTETYTYSFVSENMFDGPTSQAVEITNPLTNDFVYMRNSLIPSLLEVANNNKQTDEIKIFEIANTYLKQENDLPKENLYFAGVIKTEKADFFKVKGIIEQILNYLGITNLIFKQSEKGGSGASVFINNDYLGEIEVLDTNLIDFELKLEVILKYANNTKVFKPFAKYPPIVEDLTVIVDEEINTQDIIDTIKKQSNLITEAHLKDTYKTSRTFHIVYQDFEKNLTKENVSTLHEQIIKTLQKEFKASIK
jgi:phenylalanyl-tRNA synthetase beta chain